MEAAMTYAWLQAIEVSALDWRERWCPADIRHDRAKIDMLVQAREFVAGSARLNKDLFQEWAPAFLEQYREVMLRDLF